MDTDRAGSRGTARRPHLVSSAVGGTSKFCFLRFSCSRQASSPSPSSSSRSSPPSHSEFTAFHSLSDILLQSLPLRLENATDAHRHAANNSRAVMCQHDTRRCKKVSCGAQYMRSSIEVELEMFNGPHSGENSTSFYFYAPTFRCCKRSRCGPTLSSSLLRTSWRNLSLSTCGAPTRCSNAVSSAS